MFVGPRSEFMFYIGVRLQFYILTSNFRRDQSVHVCSNKLAPFPGSAATDRKLGQAGNKANNLCYIFPLLSLCRASESTWPPLRPRQWETCSELMAWE